MSEFSAAANITFQPEEGSLAALRSEVERELSDIGVGTSSMAPVGGLSQRQPRDPRTGQFMGIRGAEQRVIEQTALTETLVELDTERNEILADIEDDIGQGGGGGGRAGAFGASTFARGGIGFGPLLALAGIAGGGILAGTTPEDQIATEVPEWVEDLVVPEPGWIPQLEVPEPNWLPQLRIPQPDWFGNLPQIGLDVPDWLVDVTGNDGGGNGNQSTITVPNRQTNTAGTGADEGTRDINVTNEVTIRDQRDLEREFERNKREIIGEVTDQLNEGSVR